MASLNTKLRDAMIDRAVNMTRYANGLVRKVLNVLNRADVELMARLEGALERLPDSAHTVRMLDSQIGSVRELTKAAYEDADALLRGELHGLTKYEAEFNAELFGRLFPVKIGIARIDADQVFSSVLSQPFRGRLLSEWWDDLERSKAVRVRDAVRMGYAEGKTVQDMVKGIRGTRANSYADGIIATDRRNAAAVVRTAVGHTASTTRERFYEANSDVIDGQQWVSTLDSRTTEMCMVRDGLRYTMDGKPVGHHIPFGAGPGRLHWNCRSVSVPITKSFADLGLDIAELTPNERASMDGQVPAGTTYTQWLNSQSAARQDEILGPVRGRLLRQGKLDASRFWDDKGEFLSLEQLQRKDAEAFTRAGL